MDNELLGVADLNVSLEQLTKISFILQNLIIEAMVDFIYQMEIQVNIRL